MNDEIYLLINEQLYGPGRTPEDVLREVMNNGEVTLKDLVGGVLVLKKVEEFEGGLTKATEEPAKPAKKPAPKKVKADSGKRKYAPPKTKKAPAEPDFALERAPNARNVRMIRRPGNSTWHVRGDDGYSLCGAVSERTSQRTESKKIAPSNLCKNCRNANAFPDGGILAARDVVIRKP